MRILLLTLNIVMNSADTVNRKWPESIGRKQTTLRRIIITEYRVRRMEER
jgi:hypothetical protein